jgi:hypothetical protein
MKPMTDDSSITISGARPIWQYIEFMCIGVILLSVLSCFLMAAIGSVGLTKVTVTALDKNAEPRDHDFPFIKQNDALPDYTVTVISANNRTNLGTKPNESAAEGLTWLLPEPISITDIVSVRLDEQDKIISDVIAEVQLTDDTVTSGNYRFDFVTERSFSVGLKSFFKTPLGLAIVVAFALAVFLIIFPHLASLAG